MERYHTTSLVRDSLDPVLQISTNRPFSAILSPTTAWSDTTHYWPYQIHPISTCYSQSSKLVLGVAEDLYILRSVLHKCNFTVPYLNTLLLALRPAFIASFKVFSLASMSNGGNSYQIFVRAANGKLHIGSHARLDLISDRSSEQSHPPITSLLCIEQCEESGEGQVFGSFDSADPSVLSSRYTLHFNTLRHKYVPA